MTPEIQTLITFLHALRPLSISVDVGDTVITAEFAWDGVEYETDYDPEGEPLVADLEPQRIRAVGGSVG